jgi:hypothetical protein
MTQAHKLAVSAAITGAVIAGLVDPREANAQASVINVADVEQLYAAVNDPGNAGTVIVLAPGTYVLTALDPSGTARSKGGRLELQQDMGLKGVPGERDAVVIDGASLPQSSYVSVISAGLPPSATAAIRMGRGSNAVEWLTVRNAVRGVAAISTDLLGTGPALIRVAHIAATGNVRGIDVRNFGPSAAERLIDADLEDNRVYGNTLAFGEGLRFANLQGASRARIVARLSGNRVYGNDTGAIVANNQSSFAEIAVLSNGDRFVENGTGVLLIGGFSSNATVANGNTVVLEARGSHFSDNNGPTDFDQGGMVVLGAENLSIPNGASNNTVHVSLRGCRLDGNQIRDLAAIGARSALNGLGAPGIDNHVEVTLEGTQLPLIEVNDSIPDDSSWMNTAVVNRRPPVGW